MAIDTDTTDPSYWLNWRFLICALYLLATIAFASFLIWKYEGTKILDDERRERQHLRAGVLYKDEVWRTCLKGLHPVWLLGYRIFAFFLLLSLIVGNAVVASPGIFYFYTQWTFTLTTVYFGLASALSLYGCWCDNNGACHFKGASQNADEEQGADVAARPGGSGNPSLLKSLCNREEVHVRQIAGCMDYLLQIMYQFDVGMHSINILILGDTIWNCMRFPMFRIAYFILWTSLFVICQWIIHAFVSMRWPYPFMDLSATYSPLW